VDTQKIAEERIEILFSEAEEKESKDPELAERYVEIARNIGEKAQVSIPSDLKKRFCSSCGAYLKPGKNCTVRIDSEKNLIKYRCGECGEEDRYGF
jgi:ribonuclease P protein subunit RPR2